VSILTTLVVVGVLVRSQRLRLSASVQLRPRPRLLLTVAPDPPLLRPGDGGAP
jgi:hypothetical protein